jgi:ketosteroid isomerase-like protein
LAATPPKTLQQLSDRTKMTLSKEVIIELEHRLIEAIKTSDIDFLENVLHDDLLFLAPNGQVVTKEMDLTSHKSKQMTVEQLVPNFEDCTTMGDTAISIVVYDTKGVLLGQAISGQFRYIRNWKVFGDCIKIVSGACMQIA